MPRPPSALCFPPGKLHLHSAFVLAGTVFALVLAALILKITVTVLIISFNFIFVFRYNLAVFTKVALMIAFFIAAEILGNEILN